MFDELEQANARFAESFAWAGMTAPTRRHLAVVTCMDTRIDPLAVLGLEVGDAKIIRNAGGRVTDDVLRSLLLATAFLGVTHVVVMHHAKCALAGQSDDQVRAGLPDGQRTGVAEQPLLAMPDPDAALAADVAAVRSCSALPTDLAVEGWRYDVDTGRIHRLVRA
jgi:carbonic anhydrase